MISVNKVVPWSELLFERLEAKGWKVGTVEEFLELTPEEAALIEIKLAQSPKFKRAEAKTDDPR